MDIEETCNAIVSCIERRPIKFSPSSHDDSKKARPTPAHLSRRQNRGSRNPPFCNLQLVQCNVLQFPKYGTLFPVLSPGLCANLRAQLLFSLFFLRVRFPPPPPPHTFPLGLVRDRDRERSTRGKKNRIPPPRSSLSSPSSFQLGQQSLLLPRDPFQI